MRVVPAERQITSIVLLGSFNPAIFSPLWFGHFGLLPLSEAESARVDVISPAIAQFSVDWLTAVVLTDRCTFSAVGPERRELLRDLTVGVFRLLPHTPVVAVGFNHDAHFSLRSEERWHQVGHALVPKGFLEGRMRSPGTRSVVVEGQRPDGREGRVYLQIEPSLVVKNGLFVRVNDHFQLEKSPSGTAPSGTAPSGTEALLELLNDAWEPSLERAEELMWATLSVR
jgi:hypothetical protein